MKLALYLPNFRDKVTVKELEDLTALAEDLDFDSVWTLDRIVVPEAWRAVLEHHGERVAGEVLAVELTAGDVAEPAIEKA